MHVNFTILIILFPIFNNFLNGGYMPKGYFTWLLFSVYMSVSICPGGICPRPHSNILW